MQLKPVTEIQNRNGIALITGDAWTLEDDLRRFYEWNVARETFCINRSITAPYIKGTPEHWGQADAEEAIWFAKWVEENHPGTLRHTLKPGEGFNVLWSPDGQDVDKWQGGSLYMAMLICEALGYDMIILAGCPMLSGGHWYDKDVKVEWKLETFDFWEKQRAKHPTVRSMSGYTRYLFGGPEEWG